MWFYDPTLPLRPGTVRPSVVGNRGLKRRPDPRPDRPPDEYPRIRRRVGGRRGGLGGPETQMGLSEIQPDGPLDLRPPDPGGRRGGTRGGGNPTDTTLGRTNVSTDGGR